MPEKASADALRILLIEDNPGDARLTIELLREAGVLAFECARAENLERGLGLLVEQEFQIVLADLSLGDAGGIEIVERLHDRHPTLPMIVLSGLEDESVAMAALQKGAQDYLVKGQGDGHLISRSILYAMERKRVEAQLIEAKNSAEAASRAKSEFLANMSHELRTPLNAIIGFSQIIKDQSMGPDNTKRYAEYAQDIWTSGEHLLELINNVLDISKIEAGKFELSEETLDPAEIVRESVMAVQNQIALKKVALEIRPPETPVFVHADALRLRQILINLLSNAAKFTPEGGKITVAIEAGQSGPLSFVVSDTGIGMSPKEVKVALETFGQVENTLVKRYEGLGLGLPLAKRFIERHGGRLVIDSVKGTGTVIRVELPAERVLRQLPAHRVTAAA